MNNTPSPRQDITSAVQALTAQDCYALKAHMSLQPITVQFSRHCKTIMDLYDNPFTKESAVKALDPRIPEIMQYDPKISFEDNAFTKAADVKPQRKAAGVQPACLGWWASVPDRVISIWLYVFDDLTPFFHLLNDARNAGMIPDVFTAKDVIAANLALGWGISPTKIYEGLKEYRKYFGGFFRDFPPYIGNKMGGKSRKNPTGGCPADKHEWVRVDVLMQVAYEERDKKSKQIANPVGDCAGKPAMMAKPTPAMMKAAGVHEDHAQEITRAYDETLKPAYITQNEIVQELDRRAKRENGYFQHPHKREAALNAYYSISEHDTHSTPFPAGWAKNTLAAYRTAFLRGLADAKGCTGDMVALGSRPEIARMLACSQRILKSILQRAGLEGHHQTDEIPLTSADTLQRDLSSLKKEKAFPKHFTVTDAQGKNHHIPADSEGFTRVSMALSNGLKAVVTVQLPNVYEIVSEEPPVKEVRESVVPVIEPQIEGGQRDDRLSEPTFQEERPRKRAGYDPVWIHAQIKHGLYLLGWASHDGFIHPHTGEKIDFEADTVSLLEFAIGRTIPRKTAFEEKEAAYA